MADTKDKRTCFVITPIGDNNSEIRRHIDGIIDQAIEPALKDKYEIEVAHRKYEIGSINDRVVKNVYEADLVVANLTNTNPNVMYELAIRYSFGRPAIVIAEKGTKLPFDVVDENTIFYINDPAGACDLKEAIIEYEKNIDFSKKEHGPVYKVISRIPLYNEVEFGKDVSNDKVLQYVIDRLDSLEKSINIRSQVKLDTAAKELLLTNDGEVTIEIAIFTNERSVEKGWMKELMNILAPYSLEKLPEFEVNEDTIHILVTIKNKNEKEMRYGIDKWVTSKENIKYSWREIWTFKNS